MEVDDRMDGDPWQGEMVGRGHTVYESIHVVREIWGSSEGELEGEGKPIAASWERVAVRITRVCIGSVSALFSQTENLELYSHPITCQVIYFSSEHAS